MPKNILFASVSAYDLKALIETLRKAGFYVAETESANTVYEQMLSPDSEFDLVIIWGPLNCKNEEPLPHNLTRQGLLAGEAAVLKARQASSGVPAIVCQTTYWEPKIAQWLEGFKGDTLTKFTRYCSDLATYLSLARELTTEAV